MSRCVCNVTPCRPPRPPPQTQWGRRQTPARAGDGEGGPLHPLPDGCTWCWVEDMPSCSPVTSGSHQGRQRGLGLITFGCPGERQGYLGVDLAPSGGGQVRPVTKRPTRGLEMELAKRTAAGQALRVLGPAGEHNSPSS